MLIEGFCACSGTVRFAHESCIIAWAKEKWSLRCELCNTEYREPLRTRLGELIGLFPGNQRPPRRAAVTGEAAGAEEAPSRPSFWCHIIVLGTLLGGILCLALISPLVGDGSWMAILWRGLTISIPVLIFGRLGWLAISRCLQERAERRAAAGAAAFHPPLDAAEGVEDPVPEDPADGREGAPPGTAAARSHSSAAVAGSPAVPGHGHEVREELPSESQRPGSRIGVGGEGSSQGTAEQQVVVVIAPEIQREIQREINGSQHV